MTPLLFVLEKNTHTGVDPGKLNERTQMIVGNSIQGTRPSDFIYGKHDMPHIGAEGTPPNQSPLFPILPSHYCPLVHKYPPPLPIL